MAFKLRDNVTRHELNVIVSDDKNIKIYLNAHMSTHTQ